VAFMSLDQFQMVQKMLPPFLTNSLILMGCLFVIYKFAPDRNVATKNALFSSLLAAVSLYCVHKGFAYLAAKVFSYNKIYGSFAAVPLLLLWILSIWYVVLGGVALSACLEKRRDQTIEATP
jgi:membrane protein